MFTHRHLGEIAEQLHISYRRNHIHAAPAADSARNSFNYLRPSEAARCRRRKSKHAIASSTRASVSFAYSQTPKLPEIQFSLNTNYCDLGFCLAPDGQRLVIVSCEDNLIKGAAGQAVQNMNLMYGWGGRRRAFMKGAGLL